MLLTMEKQFEIEENTAPVRHLIDGEEVLYKMREIIPELKSTEWYENACPKEIMELVDELYNIVLNQPTIEVQEVKRGKWIDRTHWIGTFGHIRYECSACGFIRYGKRNDGKGEKFCEECGAKMDLED